MKEDNSEYPKFMYVGDYQGHINDKKIQREVVFKTEEGYWARTILSSKECKLWRYAQDIEPVKPEPKKEIINITLPHDIETLIMINGKEVEFKKQDQ